MLAKNSTSCNERFHICTMHNFYFAKGLVIEIFRLAGSDGEDPAIHNVIAFLAIAST